MRHHRLTAALLLGLSLAACEVHPAPQSTPALPTPTPSPSPNRETQPQPVEIRFPDCGDGDAPCVTYDDGDQGKGMYLISSYTPVFHGERINVCNAEDYPTNLPCVLRHQDPQDQWVTLRQPA